MEITFTIEQIITFCAALGAIVGAYQIIAAPVRKLNEKMKDYDTKLDNDNTRLNTLDNNVTSIKTTVESLKDDLIQEFTSQLNNLHEEVKQNDEKMSNEIKFQSKMIYQMLKHLATNNNSGGMDSALNEYVKFYQEKD